MDQNVKLADLKAPLPEIPQFKPKQGNPLPEIPAKKPDAAPPQIPKAPLPEIPKFNPNPKAAPLPEIPKKPDGATGQPSKKPDEAMGQAAKKPDDALGQAPKMGDASGQAPKKPDDGLGQAAKKPDDALGQAPKNDALGQPSKKPDDPMGQAAKKPDDTVGKAVTKPDDGLGQPSKKPDDPMGQATKKPDDVLGQAAKKPDDASGQPAKKPNDALGQAVTKPDDALGQPSKKPDDPMGQAAKKPDDALGQPSKKLDDPMGQAKMGALNGQKEKKEGYDDPLSQALKKPDDGTGQAPNPNIYMDDSISKAPAPAPAGYMSVPTTTLEADSISGNEAGYMSVPTTTLKAASISGNEVPATSPVQAPSSAQASAQIGQQEQFKAGPPPAKALDQPPKAPAATVQQGGQQSGPFAEPAKLQPEVSAMSINIQPAPPTDNPSILSAMGLKTVKVYGHPFSPRSCAVCMLAMEAGCGDMELVDINTGAQKMPRFLNINPFGKVPALSDGGFKIGETCASLRYIALKYKSTYYPTMDDSPLTLPNLGVVIRAFIDAAMESFARDVATPWEKLVMPLYGVLPVLSPTDQITANTTYNDKLEWWAKVYLRERFVCGKMVTIADFYVVPFLFITMQRGLETKMDFKLPDRIKQYIEDFCAEVKSTSVMKSGGQSVAEGIASKVPNAGPSLPFKKSNIAPAPEWDTPSGKIKLFGAHSSANSMGPILLATDANLTLSVFAPKSPNDAQLTSTSDPPPVCEDGSFTISESCATLRYMAARYKPAYYPTNEQALCGHIDFAMDSFVSEVLPKWRLVVCPAIDASSSLNSAPNQALANKECNEVMNRWADYFLKGKFVCDDKLTIVEFKVIPYIFQCLQPGIEAKQSFKVSPRFKKYWEDFRTATETAELLKTNAGNSIAEFTAKAVSPSVSAAAQHAAGLTAQADALLQATIASPKSSGAGAQVPPVTTQPSVVKQAAPSVLHHSMSGLGAAAVFATVAPAPPKKKQFNIKNAVSLKPGVYETDEGNTFGSLVAKAKPPNQYIFMVTVVKQSSTRDPSNGVWAADVVPCPKAPDGHEQAGKDAWIIFGHPENGTMFLADGDDPPRILECDQDFNVRSVWDFNDEKKGKMFSEPAGAPTKNFPSDNFMEAVYDKDPMCNEPYSPSTQTIIEACCYTDETLPKEPSKRQALLILHYTRETPLYHEMNAALREDDLFKMKYFAAYIKELRDIFRTDHEHQIVEPFEGKVWRGIIFPDPDAAMQEYAQGAVFVWPAFTSMTTNRDVAIGFGNLVFEINCCPPLGTYEDDEPEYAPASVKDFSDFRGESEVLFPPNVKFMVKEIEMPDPDKNDLINPMLKCETIGFETDKGMEEFQNDGNTAGAADQALVKLVKQQRKQIDAQQKKYAELEKKMNTLVDRLGMNDLKTNSTSRKNDDDDDDDFFDDEEAPAYSPMTSMTNMMGKGKEAQFLQQYPTLAAKMASIQNDFQMYSDGPNMAYPKASSSTAMLPPNSMAAQFDNQAQEFAQEIAEEMDREMARELASQMDREMGREMAREMARKCARMMAKGMSQKMARKVVSSKLQGQTYGVDDLFWS